MRVALEWGPVGAAVLGARSDVLVVVDVLSFSTAVTMAVECGAQVWAHPGGPGAARLAEDVGAELAGTRGSTAPVTLSPASLLGLGAGARLVLPSPNGSTIAFAAAGGSAEVVAGCLRNASAVAQHIRKVERIALVPAGERWPDGSLRPAYEDMVGAGAIADRLQVLDPEVELTPETEAVVLAFRALRPLELCPSGIELVERGYAEDVRLASEVDANAAVPVLVDGRFIAS